MSAMKFEISIPTDEGYIGRQCNSPDCQKYFRVHKDSILAEMHCPYCSTKFRNNELYTQDQIEHINAVSQEKAREIAHGEIQKMLAGLARNFQNSQSVRIEHKTSSFQPKKIAPSYTEKKVDTELHCPECDFKFQVYGIFGFCPGCSAENMLIYDANISIIKTEIAAATDKQRALRHAYGDLVSTFELFCTKKASIDKPPVSFQDIYEARRYFKQERSIDILSNLSTEDELCIRRVFQKRHAYQHSGGTITEKFIRKIPEDSALLGQKAKLSEHEFEHGTRVLKTILGALGGITFQS